MINGEIVCHWSVIQFPMRKGWKRGHRLVVLPDYQGVGVGMKFHNYCAETIKKEGFEVNSTTTTPAMINAMCRDKKWTLKRFGRSKSKMTDFVKYGTGDNKKNKQVSKISNTESNNRITYSFNLK